MSDLVDAFHEHDPTRVTATCGECDGELFDTEKQELAYEGYSYVAAIIKHYARRHRIDTGHNDLQVGIDKHEPVKTIDATITVNES